MKLTEAAIVDKVLEIISGFSGGPKATITQRSNLTADLRLDSLDQLEILMEVEATFEVNIPDDEAERIVTVQDLVHCVLRRLS